MSDVVCEFVRQRCTHDALFQPFYKRSNRTKGSKILRCFPHCCPNHAHRGFCGSSLHVRVQWPTERRSPPSIHVLGRFRLSDAPPLPLGHCLQAAGVFAAVQSDDTPNGEWIDSQMIYSWSETNWLFEINSAARWFYGWESSTVKSQRLKDHVLDVYVLAAVPAFGQARADALRVVATVTSPSFQLISFRRATDDAMLALSATHHVRQQLQNGADADEDKPPRPQVHFHADAAPPPRPQASFPALPSHVAVPVTRPLSLPSLRPTFAGVAMAAAPQDVRPPQWSAPPLAMPMARAQPAPLRQPPLQQMHPSLPPRLHQQPPMQRPMQVQPSPQLRPAALRPAALAPSVQPTGDAGPQPAWRPQPSIAALRPSGNPVQPMAAPGPNVAGGGGRDSTVWEVANLIGQLHQVSFVDAFDRVAAMHEGFLEYARDYLTQDDTADGAKPGAPPGLKADAEMGVRRAMATLYERADLAAASKLPPRLVATLTEVALWVFFDRVTLRQIHGSIHSAQVAIADPSEIQRRFRRIIFFLHDHVNRFLHNRFNTTIREVLLECQALGLELQYETPRSDATAATPAAAIKGQRPMKAQDVFVAQLREVFVQEQTAARRVRRKLDVAAMPVTSPDVRRQFNRQWTCSLDNVVVRRARSTSPLPPAHELSLFSLVWFYRQFSVVSLDLHDDKLQRFPRLEVKSLFQLSPLHSRFVLDGKDRFLHAFPAGEATLATCVGRYTMGDYVGQYSAALGEIQLRLYAFLAPSLLPASEPELPLERVARDACVCYAVRLIVSPAGALVANVTVQRGELDVAALRHVGYGAARPLLVEMATWSLQEKLSAVRAFEDASHVDLVLHAEP